MKLKTSQWISWIVATATAALTICAYAFTTFETKLDSLEKKSAIEKKLDRMDEKLDRLLLRK